MSLNPQTISIVHWYPDLEKHRCGYCKNEKCSLSYGMWATTLTVEDYQNLIDRGWRRSGKYCYKPVMDETCCPQYTIRCTTLEFKLSKSQKKAIKRLNKFLNDGIFPNVQYENITESSVASDIIMREKPNCTLDYSQIGSLNFQSVPDIEVEQPVNVTVDKSISSASTRNSISSVPKRELDNIDVKSEFKKGTGVDPNKPPCKKAKLLRFEKRQKKLLEKGMTTEKMGTKTEAKTLQQFLEDVQSDSHHKLNIKLIPTSEPDIEWEMNKHIEYEIYKKYQMQIHNDPPEKCSMEGFTKFLVNSPLKIKLVQMDESHPLFKVSAKLFEKYQIAIHNDSASECDEEQFAEFLVDTPLKSVKLENDPLLGFGSYHQQYWLDDKLIAVGVIDILPRCVSSVYFFYDPDYRFLTLGTYGSLREVQFTKNLHEVVPTIDHYYMGFYIHSCPKMRYKGKLCPSFLLCPETYAWIPIEACVPKLDVNKYSRLNDDVDALDKDYCSDKDINSIKVLLGYQFSIFRYYKYRQGEIDVFSNIGKLIGRKCAHSLSFVSSRD